MSGDPRPHQADNVLQEQQSCELSLVVVMLAIPEHANEQALEEKKK